MFANKILIVYVVGRPVPNPDYYDYVNPEKLIDELNEVDILYGIGVNGKVLHDGPIT